MRGKRKMTSRGVEMCKVVRAGVEVGGARVERGGEGGGGKGARRGE